MSLNNVSSEAQLSQILTEMGQMREKLAAQEAEIATLKAASSIIPTDQSQPSVATSRRRMLKKMGAVAAGLAVAGAVGSAIGAANPAYADDGKDPNGGPGTGTPKPAADGSNLVIGNTNTGSAQTLLLTSGAALSTNQFLVSDSATGSAYPAAVGGYGYSRTPNGVYGYSAVDSGYGVVAFGGSGSSYGALLRGSKANASIYPSGAAPSGRTGTYLLGDVIADSGGNLWYCIVGGTPGTWRKLAGPATSGTLHVFPSPGRFLDNRPGTDNFVLPGNTVPGPLPGFAPAATPPGGNIVSYKITGAAAKGSGPTIPTGATAILGNVTVIATVGADGGYLLTWPTGGAVPATSTINYNSGQVIANSFVSGLSSAGNLSLAAFKSTYVIIDVVGYYL